MTAEPEHAMRRMRATMIALSAAGAVMLFAWRGWAWSAGWIVGCGASSANFYWLRRVTESMGAGGAAKDHKAVMLGLRYLLLGGGLYVILKYTVISLPAALAGLFVPAAAVILEILIELVYARN